MYTRPFAHRAPRTSYLVHEVLWDRRFADVFTQTEDGRLAIDYRRLHNTRPLQSASAYPSPNYIQDLFRRRIADPNKIRAFCYCTVRILVLEAEKIDRA
jgi:hypothetical protein